MKKKIEIDAVALVREIRDKQAALLQGKSDKEIIDYFRKASVSAPNESTRRENVKKSKDK